MLLGYLRNRSVRGLESQFGWSASRLSRIRSELTSQILGKWSHLLDVRKCGQTLLTPEKLQIYADAIDRRSGLNTIWGFVDGTLRQIARPTRFQEAAYSGWKHFHALKYQIISTPDGLAFVSGPYDGSHNDWTVWEASRVQDWLPLASHRPNGDLLYLFGDKGYYSRGQLITPFKNRHNTADETDFNVHMSMYRITVEWVIGSIPMLWTRLANRCQQKTSLTPVASYYLVGVILRNALSCIQGNTA